MIPSGYQQLAYESVPMYAPGTPVAVTPVYPNYELIPNRVFIGGFPSSVSFRALVSLVNKCCTNVSAFLFCTVEVSILLQTTEVELRQHFEPYCEIREAKVIRSAEGSSKGYGFLTFENDDDAENIKNLVQFYWILSCSRSPM